MRDRVGRKWTQGRGTGAVRKVSRLRKVWEWMARTSRDRLERGRGGRLKLAAAGLKEVGGVRRRGRTRDDSPPWPEIGAGFSGYEAGPLSVGGGEKVGLGAGPRQGRGLGGVERARAGGGGAEDRSALLCSEVCGGGGSGDAHKSGLWLHWCSRRAAAGHGRRGLSGAPAGEARAMSRGPAWPPRGRRAGPVPRRPRPRGSGLGRPPPGNPRTAAKRRSARCSTCCAP